jgi:hypothetical protein
VELAAVERHVRRSQLSSVRRPVIAVIIILCATMAAITEVERWGAAHLRC